MKPSAALLSAITKQLNALREVFTQKNLQNISRQIFNPGESPELKALSAAAGIFIGIMPVWGFQTFAALFLAVAFKLNRVLVLLFSQISFPALVPMVVYASYRAGGLWYGSKHIPAGYSISEVFTGKGFEQYLAGSITLALAAGIAAGLLTYTALRVRTISRRIRQMFLVIKIKNSAIFNVITTSAAGSK